MKKLKQLLFPVRHRLKQIERQIEELREISAASLALQRKRDIEAGERFQEHLGFLLNAASSPISPSFAFTANDLRPVVTRREPSKTIVCTIALGETYRAAVVPCLESHRLYAERWNFSHAELGAPPSRLLRHPSWYKLPFVHHLTRLGYERIAFFDADALITEPEVRVDGFFDRLSNAGGDLLLGNDESGANMGVFFARSGPRLPVLLDLIWHYDFDPNHVTWEQLAVRTLLDEQPAVAGRILLSEDGREFNSFPAERAQIHKLNHQAQTWEPGDFICHFSGIAPPRLPALIADYQRRAKR